MMYFSILSISVKEAFKWRANFILQVTQLILPLLGFFFLYKVVNVSGTQIGPYGLREIFTYYFWALLTYVMSPIYASYEITDIIKSGKLTYFMTRPVSFIKFWTLLLIGNTFVWLLTNLIAVTPVIVLLRKYFIPPTINNFLLGILFSILGFLLGVHLGFMLQSAAFYMGDPYGLADFYGYALSILGGSVIPLDILPKIMNYLPFKYLYYIPSKAFMGQIQNPEKDLLICVSYILLFAIINNILWKKGFKKYEAYGG